MTHMATTHVVIHMCKVAIFRDLGLCCHQFNFQWTELQLLWYHCFGLSIWQTTLHFLSAQTFVVLSGQCLMLDRLISYLVLFPDPSSVYINIFSPYGILKVIHAEFDLGLGRRPTLCSWAVSTTSSAGYGHSASHQQLVFGMAKITAKGRCILSRSHGGRRSYMLLSQNCQGCCTIEVRFCKQNNGPTTQWPFLAAASPPQLSPASKHSARFWDSASSVTHLRWCWPARWGIDSRIVCTSCTGQGQGPLLASQWTSGAVGDVRWRALRARSRQELSAEITPAAKESHL